MRQKNLCEGIEKKKHKSRPPRSEAWSDKKNKQERKKFRRDVKTKNQKRKIEKTVESVEENDDLESDFKMLKKFKKGKVNQILGYIFISLNTNFVCFRWYHQITKYKAPRKAYVIR